MSLTRLSVSKEKQAKDPKKVLEKEHVFKVFLEESQEIYFFSCTTALKKLRVVGLLENFLDKCIETVGKKSVFSFSSDLA